ncbi:hypothetical protein FRB96_009432 [Tulasnella sp. 330]|nr:hypothetical protein FRB96_009432 [Tulasnella sp. 330]KAG8870906.1 hypothetical protein FRB97_009265 [Tulasnella sp. 331]KAG8873592.1 hypothetical protein FRB98_008888 [Tulasnella sp. 332]
MDGISQLNDSLVNLTKVVISLILVVALGKALREYVLIPKLTVIKDLQYLGKPRMDGRIPGTVVVCGGSVAGLVTAAVCADHYESVIVVEPEISVTSKDSLQLGETQTRIGTDGASMGVSRRTRVPQWLSTHLMLPMLYKGLEKLFLNLQEELDRVGVEPIPLQIRLGIFADPYSPKDNKKHDPTSSLAPLSISLTREALEVLLRRLVTKSRSNVQITRGTVVSLERAKDGDNRLDGVVVRTEAGRSALPAQLVVDATGQAQAGFKWLKAAGLDQLPVKDEYDQKRRIVTATFTVPPHLHPICRIPWGYRPGSLVVYPPDASIGETYGLIWCISDRNKAVMTIAGQEYRDKPHSAASFRSAVTAMPGYKLNRLPGWVIEFLDFLVEYETECAPYYDDLSIGTFRWLKYNEMASDALPRNFVAIGDASMNLNPAGGQGCSKAMSDAITLDACLRRTPSQTRELPYDFSLQYFQKQAARIKPIWTSMKDQDYAFGLTQPVKGETLAVGAFRRRYRQAALKLCAKDPEVFKQILNVMYLLAPPTDVFAPMLAIRIFREMMR